MTRFFSYMLTLTLMVISIRAELLMAEVYCPHEKVGGIKIADDKLMYKQGYNWRTYGNFADEKTQAAMSILMYASAAEKPLTVYYPDGFNCELDNQPEMALSVTTEQPYREVNRQFFLQCDSNYCDDWGVEFKRRSVTTINFEINSGRIVTPMNSRLGALHSKDGFEVLEFSGSDQGFLSISEGGFPVEYYHPQENHQMCLFGKRNGYDCSFKRDYQYYVLKVKNKGDYDYSFRVLLRD